MSARDFLLPPVFAGVAMLIAAHASAAEPSRFEGDWDVSIDCPSNTEETNAKGYAYHFPATVKDGVMTGGRGTSEEPGSLYIEGPIAVDGTAMLQARGRTGDPAYAVKHPSTGSPYTYRIRAMFDDRRGTGKRLEARECGFVFVKK